MDSVRVGIVGIGNIGTVHATFIANGNIKGMTLGALCDISPEREEYCKNHFPDIPVYASHTEMFKSGKIDAVIVSTPHRFHTDIATEAMEHNLHVLVEKPIDITVTKAAALNEKSRPCGKVFAMMLNQRTSEVFSEARRIVKSGELGELKRTSWTITNWYRTQEYYNSATWRGSWKGEGGGVLINQAPHNIDLWQWICGMPDEITAFCDIGKFHNIEVEDNVTIFARYANGATGTFITSTGEFPGTNRLEIAGTLGKLVAENGILKLWKLSENERDYCFDKCASSRELTFEYSEKSDFKPETAHMGILQNFANAILYGEELLSPGIDGINELTISNAAYLSSWKGNVPVSLPFDTEEFDSLLAKLRESSVMRNGDKTNNVNSDTYINRWQTRW